MLSADGETVIPVMVGALFNTVIVQLCSECAKESSVTLAVISVSPT